MVLGLTLATYTAVHVAFSLIGIGSGFVVLFGLLQGKSFRGWTVLFLATTVATSVTGFGFPVAHFLPSHGVGILSLIALAENENEYGAERLRQMCGHSTGIIHCTEGEEWMRIKPGN